MSDAKIVVRAEDETHPWVAQLICKGRKSLLPSGNGWNVFDHRRSAEQVARWWSDHTGIPWEAEE